MKMSETWPLFDYGQDTPYDPSLPPLGEFAIADEDDAIDVLQQPVGTTDGRSNFMWIRLRNGDLILGVFPEGDTYFKYEEKYP
jgi:hypothetical protein